MGPHPAVAEVRRAVRSLLATQQRSVLVACSGGADSLALAAAAAFVAPRLRLRAGLVTVDHGLQDGSAARAAQVAAIGYELGFDPVETITVDVGAAGGPEAAAREARYRALDAVADALDASVLLGHTLDDQAETVLLGLGRGSGPRSIAGMRPVGEGRYLRPLLGVRRETTVAACRALGLTAWDDPHNADPSFQRVRLRREVLPLLEDVLQGGVAEALARTAALVQDDLDALDAMAAEHASHAPLDVAALADQPRAIRTRILRAWAASAGAAPLTAKHLAALDALVVDWHGQGAVDLPGGLRAERASGKLNAIPPNPH
jgi:tRNA(Ile)-lysidine synthase